MAVFVFEGCECGCIPSIRESLCHSLAPTLASPARKTYRRQGRRQIWLNQRHLGNLTLSAEDARRSHNHPQPVQHQPAGFDEGRLDLDALAGLDRIDVERYYSPNLFSLLLLACGWELDA